MEILLIWGVLAIAIGIWADSRGRNGFGYFVLALLLSPLLGMIILLIAGDKNKEKQEADERAAQQQREHERQLESLRAITTAARPAESTPPPAPRPSASSVADEILKLGQLRDRGLLTDGEFAEQKAAVLATRRPKDASPAPAAVEPPQPLEPIALGRCPNCEVQLPLKALSCPRCNADFGPQSAWKVKPA